MKSASRTRSAFSMIEVLVVLGLIAFALALILPAIQRIREAAARAQDMNNQKQLVLGAHNFLDTFRKFPFNGTKGSFANPKDQDSGSWIYQLLPFIEQENLFRNPKAGENVVIPILLCPGRARQGLVTDGKFKGPVSDYAINTWINDPVNGTLSLPSRKPGITDITDGTSNTIFMGQLSLRTTDYAKTDGGEGRETIFVGGTMGTGRNQPRHFNDGPDIDFANRFGGPFRGVTIFGLCDGSVRTIPITFDLRPALTPNGGEPFEIP